MLVIQNKCVIALTIGCDMHTSLIIFEGSSLWPLFVTSSVLQIISRTRNKKRWFMDCKGASLLRINHIDNAINMAERNRSNRYCQFLSCIRIATFFCSAIFWLSCFHGITFGKKIYIFTHIKLMLDARSRYLTLGNFCDYNLFHLK